MLVDQGGCGVVHGTIVKLDEPVVEEHDEPGVVLLGSFGSGEDIT